MRNWHIFVIAHMYMYVTGYIFEINVENFLSKLRCSLSLLTKVCLYEKHWDVIFVFWIVSVTVLYNVFISFPRMIVWRPFLCRFLLSFGKRIKLSIWTKNKMIVALIYTANLKLIRNHCVLYKQHALSTRKYLCACAKFRSAVTLEGVIKLSD